MMAFQLAWDSIMKNDQRLVPSWMKEEEAPIVGDDEITGVGVNEIPPQGDKCCEDLRTELIRIDDKYRGTTAELIFEHTQFQHDESCDELEEVLNDQIGYGEFLLKDYFGQDDSWEGQAKREMMNNMSEQPDKVFNECLDELKQAKLEYEACKGTQFGEVNHLDFTASDDLFEVSWDSIMKAPLDMDSLRPFAYSPDDAEKGRVEGFQVADFVDPQTGERYPMIVSTPSYSHDFNVDIDYPANVERGFDNTIGNKVANSNVHYYNDEEPEGKTFSMDYPAQGTVVGISPYVAESFRRKGMAQAIYDLVSLLGYRVKASEHLSDEAQAMWNKNQGRDFDALDEQPIWQQGR